MMKQLILTCLLSWAFISVCVAQKDKLELKVKFGKISEEEIKMTSYEKDPNAPAVVLFDKAFFSRGNFNGMERHIRIKIFKKEAYGQANFRIIFNRGTKEVIDGLKATCYNMENGKLVETKATSENFFEESLNKDIFVKKVNVPGVREGSIVEMKYTINNPDIRDWSFQDEIPVIWSEYEMQIPDFYLFGKIGQGSTPYALNTQDRKSETLTGTDFTFNLLTYHWIQKDVPALKSEKYMTSLEDYKTKMIFYLEEIRPPNSAYQIIVKPWGEMAKIFMEDSDFGDFITKKSAMKEELEGVAKPTMTPIDKVQAIYDYVGKTFDVVDYGFSISLSSSLKDLKTKKKVTVTDKNLIFMNMLTQSGITVAPVLLRTRDEGHLGTDKAVMSRFNRVISHVKIDKDTFFVDASGYPQPMKLLPFDDLSGYGIEFLGKEKYEIVSPQSKITNKNFNQAILNLDTEGSLSGDINVTNRGYDAFYNRKQIRDNGGLEKYMQLVLKEAASEGKIESHKFDGFDKFGDETLKGNMKIKTAAFVNKADDKMYVNPLLCFGEKENVFKSENRTFDVDFGTTKEDMYQLVLKIPEGYKVEEMPKNMRVQISDGAIKYDFLISEKDNSITLNTKLVIKKTTFLPEQYQELKELYAKMIAKTGEQIVLVKAAK
jgi:Domain of Unknown Function with PDB structure (DUF3857)